MNIKFGLFILGSVTVCSLVLVKTMNNDTPKGNLDDIVSVVENADESADKVVSTDSPLSVLADKSKRQASEGDSLAVVSTITEQGSDATLSEEDEHPLREEVGEASDIKAELSSENEDYEVALQHEFAFSEEAGEDSGAWQAYADYFSSAPINGLAMSNLECHESTCRVEFAVEKPDASELLLAKLGDPPLDKGGTFYISEDSSRLVIFAKHRIVDVVE